MIRNLIHKLIPGVGLCLAFASLIGFSRAQNSAPGSTSTSANSGAAAPQAPQYATPAPQVPQQVIVCGNCGAQIAAPQIVYVSQPIGRAPGAAFYGIPPMGYPAAPAPAPRCAPAGYYYDGDGCEYLPGAPAQSAFPLSTQWRLPAHEVAARRAYFRGY